MNKTTEKGCFQMARYNSHVFFISFLEKSGIHGFFYFAQIFLHYLEKQVFRQSVYIKWIWRPTEMLLKYDIIYK